MAGYEASAATLASDMAALDAKIGAEDGYTNDLQQAITNLDALISQLRSAATGTGTAGAPTGSTGSGQPSGAASPPSGSGEPSPGGTPTGAVPSAGSSGQSGAGQTAQPASAAQIAADQKAIDAAEAQVTAAKQNLAAATLTSPAAGKIAAVGLTKGDSSSGQTITIVGTGVQGVSAAVPLAEVDLVKAGQRVTVSAAGHTTALHGTVGSVGLMSSTSGSTTTFPVAVELDAISPKLYDGTSADVVITTATASNVITVPNSAIHTGVNGTHTVTVVKGGATSTVPVTLGVAGNDITQIKSGLKVGQQVMLADLSQQLPSSTTSSSSAFTPGQFFGGRLGGGAAGGG
jgi:multidrug efflux pump subunit AcrA (membrane-fusion protein)